MFFIERISSLFTFSAVLFTAMLGMSILKNNQYKIPLWGYWIALGVFAFIFIPNPSADLTRLHALCVGGWCQNEFYKLAYSLVHTNAPAWMFFSWAVYQITHNENFIQTIACLWSFFNVFYIISSVIQNNNIRKYNRALILFSIMAVGTFYIEVISGMRSMLSFSIICFCIYRELVERKNFIPHLPLYLFASLMHPAGIALITIRILASVMFQNNIISKIVVFMLCVSLLLGIYLYGKIYVETAVDLAISYSTDENEYSYIWEVVIGLIEQFQIYFVLYHFKKRYSNTSFTYTSMARLCLITALISLCGLPFSYAIFRRFTIVASIFLLPVLGKLLSNQKRVSNMTIKFIWALCFIIYFLSCARGDLCSYKFFMLG